MPTRQGSIKLFRLFGIDVYVHYSWFLAFYILPKIWNRDYSNYGWNLLDVLGLFLIVLTHEFGHQLACRQVGGRTHDIVLFPLGGVAYVTPPPRPGAELWSIAAGPLVNVVLIPVLSVLVSMSSHLYWYDTHPDLYEFVHNIWKINILLLIFNMMPVYPLDGGQILRSLLWFVVGRANSLFAASYIGFLGVAGLFLLAGMIYFGSPSNASKLNGLWVGAMALLILMNCWRGLRQAQALAKIAKIPRREGFACPSCKTSPPLGELWRCGKCGKQFDTFLNHATCPHCGVQYASTQCLDCGASFPVSEWKTAEF